MFTLLKKKLRSSAAVSAVIFAGLPVLMASTTVGATTLTFETIALDGGPVPGAPAGTAFSLLPNTPIALNNQGEVAFDTFLTGSGVTLADIGAIFSNGGGTSSLVARGGDAAPGAGDGVSFTSFAFSDPVLNNQGEIAFQADLTGSGVTGTNNTAIFSDAGGVLSLVAREGDSAPGTGGGETFSGPFRSVSLNDQGEVAFEALVGPGVNEGIFSNAGGTLSLVVRDGDAAPGVGDGVSFIALDAPVLNNQGEVAFTGFLTGPDITSSNRSAIFSNTGGDLSLAVREGDAAPGTEDGTSFDSLGDAELNDQGEIAFQAELRGDGVTNLNNSAIFSDAGGTLSLVARTGDAAPGTEDGVLFAFFGDPALNNQGEIAFEALLAGGNANNVGIFIESDGILSLLLRKGDLVDLGDGDLATIIALSFINDGFNDAGQLAFTASFSDGRDGFFLATPDGVVSPVPLPAALPLMASGLMGLVMIARRRRSAQA